MNQAPSVLEEHPLIENVLAAAAKRSCKRKKVSDVHTRLHSVRQHWHDFLYIVQVPPQSIVDGMVQRAGSEPSPMERKAADGSDLIPDREEYTIPSVVSQSLTMSDRDAYLEAVGKRKIPLGVPPNGRFWIPDPTPVLMNVAQAEKQRNHEEEQRRLQWEAEAEERLRLEAADRAARKKRETQDAQRREERGKQDEAARKNREASDRKMWEMIANLPPVIPPKGI